MVDIKGLRLEHHVLSKYIHVDQLCLGVRLNHPKIRDVNNFAFFFSDARALGGTG